MHFNKLAQLLRIPAIALFSILLASCGSGSGKDSVDAGADEVTASKLSLVFRDDFGGAPVGSRTAARIPPAPLAIGNWVVDTGYGSNGWGNDEWQRYDNSMDNLFTQDGSLVIRAKCTAPVCGKRDGTITSAKITTKDRLNVRHGTIKARIKMPSGLGMWPAFWTLGSDIDDRPWPDAGELDIVEMHYYYSDTRTTHFSTHWSGPRYTPENRPVCSSFVGSSLDPNEEEHCSTKSKTFDEPGDVPLTDDFHVYEMEWNENSIRGKIDGITYFTQAIDGATMEEFLKDHYLILNVAVGGTLGGPNGPAMSAADWADPDQTDMLVDWVEVYEKVPPTQATLIDESGNNLDYGRIINSAEVGGAFVESDEDSIAVTPLVGSQVLKLIYSTSVSENGGVPASFSGAIFDFNNIDLSSFTKVVFSIDTSQFPGFDHIGIQFEDSQNGRVLVWTSDYTPTAISGRWETYEIPLSDFAGVDLGDIVRIGFFNPHDSSHTLIAGTLYIDDIRFVTEPCSAVGSVAFDSINYNPATPVAAVSVSDICAAGSLATVKVENGLDEIVVGVKLDAAGNGETVFNLLADNSVCSSDDSGALMKLSGPLMATYTRTYIDASGTQQFNTATATAGIDPAAPGTSITGEKSYFYTSDPDQALSFLPDVDFNYSIFGSGSVLNGAFSDSTFDPVFAVTSGPDYGAEVAQIAMINLPAGFSAGKEAINFKIKNQPNNLIKVEFGVLGGAADARVVDLLDTSVSTSIVDGWYSVSIPMTDFPNAGVNDFLAITSGDPAPPTGSTFTYLITDIFLQDAVGGAPAECADVVQPPITGSGTGATGATGSPFSVSFDDMAVTYSFVGFGAPDTINATAADPVDAGNLVVQTTKLAGSQVWAGVTVETTPGITWPVSVAESEITIRIYSPGPGLVVRMKLEESATAANSVEAEAVATVTTGWETLTFDFGNPVAGSPAINPAFAYDKLSLFFGFGTPGDGTTYTWDTIEFQGTGGGPGGELLTNGDFEAGDLSGWSQAGAGGTFSADDTQDSGSTWTAHVVAGVAENPSLSQANLAMGSVMPGDTIDISFDLCGTAASGGEIAIALLSEFGVGMGADRNELIRLANPPSVWTRYNYSPAAGVNVDGGVSMQFDVICGGAGGCSADVYLDNVSVTVGGGTAPGTASGQGCAGGGGGPTEPAAAAPTPTLDPLDVIAVFSDAYPIVLGPGAVDYNPNWGQATVVTTEMIAGNDTLKYAGLNYQGTDFGGPQDLTAAGMTNLHVDFWTADSTALNVYVIGAGESPVALTPDPGNWVSVDIPLTDFTGVDMSQAIQFKFDGNGTIFIDNLYFSCAGCGGGNAFPTAPTVAAPTPTLDPMDVVAVFSDAYPVVLGPGMVDYNPNWGQATVVTTEMIAGNDTLKYAGLNYQGTDFGGAQDLTAAGMTHLHVDFWTVDSTALNVYVIGAGESPVALTPSFGNWVSVDIPLTDFTGVDMSQAIQFKFDGNGTIFIDNLYFFSGGGGAGGELAVNGDFETGDFTGWEQFVNSGTQSFSSDTPDASTFSAALSGNTAVGAGGTTEIKQANLGSGGGLALGDVLNIQFDVKGTFGPGGQLNVLSFTELGGGGGTLNDNTVIAGGVDDWTHYDYNVTLAGPNADGGYSLAFNAVCGAVVGCFADVLIDNVSIIFVP